MTQPSILPLDVPTEGFAPIAVSAVVEAVKRRQTPCVAGAPAATLVGTFLNRQKAAKAMRIPGAALSQSKQKTLSTVILAPTLNGMASVTCP